ncbi:MAG: methylated-DNA--[protein]-cysteine S-methyltransferase [Pirellulaceae bacterium]|nr:methylated-DNA--[protein]-cysteine S-methyltransferase [Pirellulaceae bacterium]
MPGRQSLLSVLETARGSLELASQGGPQVAIVWEVCSVFPSQLGWMAVRFEAGRLKGLAFDHDDPQAALLSLPGFVLETPDHRLPGYVRQVRSRLQAYAEGQRDDFQDVPVDSAGWTDFQRRVMEHCRLIPWGMAITYAELAARAGAPGAARAVGNVMSSNRFPLIVPCHRVVGAGGRLGGYSARHGLDTKRRLLVLEGIRL